MSTQFCLFGEKQLNLTCFLLNVPPQVGCELLKERCTLFSTGSGTHRLLSNSMVWVEVTSLEGRKLGLSDTSVAHSVILTSIPASFSFQIRQMFQACLSGQTVLPTMLNATHGTPNSHSSICDYYGHCSFLLTQFILDQIGACMQ